MTQYRFEAEPAVELEIESTFDWYETEEPGLGREFLEQLRAAYYRVLENPFAFQELSHGIRRALNSPVSLCYLLHCRKRHNSDTRSAPRRQGPGRMATANLEC